MDKPQIHTFKNGIRLVHKQVSNTKIAHCGFMLDIGSRDELPHEVGIAHFWEHMAFKGTTRRKAFHIINRLEVVGGDLNAYTTKEKICFHASLLSTHFERAIELLTDITFHSIFPEREISKERGVILEEMSMYEDDPADAIEDAFDALIFGEHPLGQNILGTRESVRSFSKASFDAFIGRNLNTERVVLASVGPHSFEQVIKLCEKYLAEIPHIANATNRKTFDGFQAQNRIEYKPIGQSHCMLGGLSYSLHDANRLPFVVLNNLLGGPGMNSRLNLSIREKYGYVYSVYSNFIPFTETGLFSIQFATEPETFQKTMNLVNRELKKLQETPLGKMQLHTAKQQMIGQLAMAEESNLGLMLMFAKSLLDYNRIDSLESVLTDIEAINALDLQRIAQEIFKENNLFRLEYHPSE